MIKIVLGNLGSGKTSSVVLYMKENKHKFFITNINVKGNDFSHVMKLSGDMIIKKEILGYKRDGTPNVKLSLNKEFWQNIVKEKGSLNVVIDEAHTLLNPRRSTSRLNLIMNDFLSMLRRVMSSSDAAGELILITQLSRRLDVVARELSTDVQFTVNHYLTRCNRCKSTWWENNEMANRYKLCPKCHDWHIHKIKNNIEIICFKNIDYFELYRVTGKRTYYARYIIKNIEDIFKNFNTLQWEDMLSEFY